MLEDQYSKRSALEGMLGLAAGVTGALRLPPANIARMDKEVSGGDTEAWRWMEEIGVETPRTTDVFISLEAS
ncbi:Hypothetical protein SMAX5B_021427 [Scophthalmus maximus]|uniref:Uncharacterized protein n=1 Tax=Scophthalmus maximus TaxID=52904 RepID=A0A2U9B1I0_SCOMX|nr:Hypothetical protein SMAX5B_021427 [Scophthalmus maximus]